VPSIAAGVDLAARHRLPRTMQLGGLLNDARQRTAMAQRDARSDPARHVPDNHMDELARRLAAALSVSPAVGQPIPRA
jgi:hypothetical protein